MKTMQHLDSSSITGSVLTIFCGVFAHVTKSDVALVVTILAGITTIAINIQKIIKSTKDES
jgi:hypothetical protein